MILSCGVIRLETRSIRALILGQTGGYPSSSNVPFVRGRDIRNVASQGPSSSEQQLTDDGAGVQRQGLQRKTEDPLGYLLALCFFIPHMGSLDHNHAS
jgi:hypothetical protein